MVRPESFYAQVQFLASEKEDEKFPQTFYVKYKVEELIYLLDVMDSVYDNVIANKPICKVLEKLITLF